MASQIKLRRGTAAQWTSTNPTLALGEAGFESDTNKLKIGDGTTAWDNLDYIAGVSASIDLSDYLTMSSASTTYLTQNSASITYAPINYPTVTGDLTVENFGGINLSNNSRIWPNNGGLYIQSSNVSLSYSSSVELPENTTIGGLASATQKWTEERPIGFKDKTSTSNNLNLNDIGKIVRVNNSSENTIFIPSNGNSAFPIGTQITILQTGTGQTTITFDTAVTLNATPGNKLRAQWSSATLIKLNTDEWVAIGDLVA